MIDEDKAWLLFRCIELSQKINRFGTLEKIIADAKKISAFVLELPEAEILKMVKKEGD